jgi:hypothetical protein
MAATTIRRGALSVQVCVPADWTDEQIKGFADRDTLCGTASGWFIRREGDRALAGDPERQQCATLEDHVHVMLDA